MVEQDDVRLVHGFERLAPGHHVLAGARARLWIRCSTNRAMAGSSSTTRMRGAEPQPWAGTVSSRKPTRANFSQPVLPRHASSRPRSRQ